MSDNVRGMLAIILIIIGVFLGLYVGVWYCFIGGIVDIIEQIRSADMSAVAVAIGITKVVFSGVLGWLSSHIFFLFGKVLIDIG